PNQGAGLMSGPIVIALDGSKFSEAALPWALEMSRRAGVGLDIVSVAEPIPTLEYTDWNTEAERWTRQYVEHLVEEYAERAGGPVTGQGIAGIAVDRILTRAADVGASMIVAATHGRGPLARTWLGSVADGLLRTAPVSVLLVRPVEEDEEITAPPPEVDHILTALDGSTDSEAALDEARRWSRAFDATLHLVQVVTWPREIASPYLPQTVALNRSAIDETRRQAEEHLATLAARLRGEGLDIETHVVEDVHGSGGIGRTAEEIGADLLVMATHGRSGVRRALLGSVTDKVVRSTHAPVLVTHIPHESE
ncbi:MAG: universal stress protein, partial [Longimicrobiales bacterium]|nr:universal stress protein [Longimicrobiales bacterium]